MSQILTPGDFRKKEPTKQEKLIYELYLNLQGCQRMIALLQRQILGMAKLQKIDPKELALIWADDKANMDYYQLVKNEQDLIIKQEGEKAMSEDQEQAQQAEAEAQAQAEHEANVDAQGAAEAEQAPAESEATTADTSSPAEATEAAAV